MSETHRNSKVPRSKVLIVDDHPAVREALSMRISQCSDLEVCGEADEVTTALKEMEEQQPDIVIVDLSLKRGDGLDLIKRIKNRDEGVRILVWSMYGEKHYAERALRAGATGYITKEHATSQIIDAIRDVLAGKIYLSAAMSDLILHRVVSGGKNSAHESPTAELSDRELEVFRMIGQGIKTSEIAQQLHLSVRTVWTYRDRIREKMRLADGAELVRCATYWTLENEK